MGWGAKESATQLTTLSDVIQWFDLVTTLNPGEIAQVEIELNPVATPTDDLSYHVRCTLDESSENWDDEDFMSGIVPNDNDPNKLTFLVSGVYKFRVGVQSTGTTDDHTSADMSLRKDGVSA